MTPIALDRHIEVTPGTRGGRPRIAGTRITVSDVAAWHLSTGLSLEEIAGTYDLSLAAVHAAMAYYYDHKSEIDQRMNEDRAFAQAFQARHPSPLQEKLGH